MVGSGGCDPRIEAIVKLKSRGGAIGWGSGGCELRIEDIKKKSGSGWWGSSRGSGRCRGR